MGYRDSEGKYKPSEKEKGTRTIPWPFIGPKVWVSEPIKYHYKNLPLLKTTMFSNGFELSLLETPVIRSDVYIDDKDLRTQNGYNYPEDLEITGPFGMNHPGFNWHNTEECSIDYCGRGDE